MKEPTEFAPAERRDGKEIQRQVEQISHTPLMFNHLDIIPDPILVLNQERQIVFANKAALNFLSAHQHETIFGLRPGDALCCAHTTGTGYSCGTTSPYFFADEHYVVLVLNDISDEKRREVLERIFFHDVNNTLQILLTTVEIMPPHNTLQENELANVITTSVQILSNDVQSQQSLLQAEAGDLLLRPVELRKAQGEVLAPTALSYSANST